MRRRRSATTSTDEQRARMVERQLRDRGIAEARVLAAMEEVPREEFVAERDRRRAYDDGALGIGEGQTISQPWIVARMTELLELDGAETVLEIGTGSGYGAAVLSRCTRTVVTMERRGALATAAAERLARLGFLNVEVVEGDGTLGAPGRTPFGGISVTAGARGGPPAALMRQLAPGAALVCPVDGQLVRYRGGAAEAVAAVRFVPLVEG